MVRQREEEYKQAKMIAKGNGLEQMNNNEAAKVSNNHKDKNVNSW